MHNWRLLIVAFLAVFHPIASFTERNLVDGREQSCDLKPHLRERRLLYGTDVRGKALPDNRLLNHARNERPYAVRQNFALSSSDSDRTKPERRLERRIDTNQRGYSFGSERLARVNFQRSKARDTSTERSVRTIEHARFTRQLDDRRVAREYSEASPSRLQDTSRLSRQRITENRDSLGSRELQRSRDLPRESNQHRYIRETRDILQRTRDDLTRTRNDQRLVRERFEETRNVLNRPESRDIRAEEERHYLRLSDRRFSMQRGEGRGDSRTDFRQHLNNGRRIRSLDRTDVFENRRERTDERRSSDIRSAVVDNDSRRYRSSERSDRNNVNERPAAPPNVRIDNRRERKDLARDDRRVSRSDERRFESRLENDNRDRRSINLSDRRLSRERMSVDRQRDMRVRETRDDSHMSRQSIERRQREANDRSESRSGTTESRETSQRMDSRNRQLERSVSRRQTRNVSGRDVTRNRDNLERRMSRSASTDREARGFRRETRQTQVLDALDRTVQPVKENHPEMTRKDTRYRMNTIRTRDLPVSPKSYSDEVATLNWQYLFYTMQAIYLSGLLYQMATDNVTDKAKSRFSWWKISSNNLIKLD